MIIPNETLSKIVNSGKSHVNYDKDSLLKSLTEGNRNNNEDDHNNDNTNNDNKNKRIISIPYPGLFNFFVLLAVFITVTVLTLTFSISYIKDVLLYKRDLTVTRNGVFMPNKSCGREYCLFLFNTSELWANTGIYLNKGDKFKMSVSGAFHSSVEDMRRDAENNNPCPEIRWIGGKQRQDYSSALEFEAHSYCYKKLFGFKKPKTDITTILQNDKLPYCVDSGTYIGAILYRIAPEHQPWKDTVDKFIHVWKPEIGQNFHKVCSSGVLTLAVNDIYFKNEASLRNYTSRFPIRFDTIFDADSVLKYDIGKEDYKKMFYNDNLGQILVCLEIQHPLTDGMLNPLSAFRNLDTALELKTQSSKKYFVTLIKALPNIALFIFHITCIYLFYVLIAIVAVGIIFKVGVWGYDKLKGVKSSDVSSKNKTPEGEENHESPTPNSIS